MCVQEGKEGGWSFQFPVGDHVHMTSAQRGEGFKNCIILRTNSTDRLREMRTRGRGGLKS